MDNGPISPAAPSLVVSQATPQPLERTSEHRELIQAVRALNGAEVFGESQELQFQIDRDTRRPILKIVDKKTGEVIVQVPQEQVLRLAKQLEKH